MRGRELFARYRPLSWLRFYPLEIALVTLTYWIQYRYFVFSLQFGNLTQTFGENHPDAFYALGIIYQNLLNLREGRWYSLAGDHYAWYEGIIGTTHHMYAWTPLAALLARFWDEPLGIYNVLYFLNLVLIQFGVYFLLRLYTRSRLVALLVSLLVPIGPSLVGISYGLHPHVFLYAGMIWALYALERFKLSSTRRAALGWGVLFGVGYLYTLVSDWHSAIFAHVLLVPFGVYYLRSRPLRRHKLWRVGVLGVALVVPLLVTVPLGLGFLQTSRNFNTTRSLRAISILQRGRNTLNNSLGLGTLAGPVFENVYPRVSTNGTEAERIALARRFTRSNLLYPEIISTLVFWTGGLGLALAAFLDRRRLRRRSVLFYGVVVLGSLIALGPFVVVGMEMGSMKLPYYYIYKLVYPLQAIRYIYRVQAVTYLAALVTLGLWLAQGRVLVETKLLESVSSGRKRLVSGLLVSVLAGTLISVQSVGHERVIDEPAEYELSLSEFVADYNLAGNELDYYYIGRDLFDTYNLNLFTSYHNYKRGFRELSWVTHGISGFHPQVEETMEGQMTRGDNYNLLADTLSAQGVDLIIAHEPDLNFAQERALKAHYKRLGTTSDERFAVFALETPAAVNQDWSSLEHQVGLSRTQSEKGPVFYTLGLRNAREEVYTKATPTATTQEYELRILNEQEQEVGRQTLAYSEFAHLWPGYGSAQTFELSPRLARGKYTAVLDYAEEEKGRSSFEVVSAAEYAQKITQAEELTVRSESLPVPEITRNDVAVPLQTKLQIQSGVWQNYPAKTELRPNYSLMVEYRNPRDNTTQTQTDICAPEGNYFAGDTLVYACRFVLPAEPGFEAYRADFFVPTAQQ